MSDNSSINNSCRSFIYEPPKTFSFQNHLRPPYERRNGGKSPMKIRISVGQNPVRYSDQIATSNPFCSKASKSTSATQFERFNERLCGLNIGRRSQPSRFCSSKSFGRPAG